MISGNKRIAVLAVGALLLGACSMTVINLVGMNPDGQFAIAQSGDSFVNPLSNFANDVGYLIPSDIAGLATTTALTSGLAGKQPTITTGTTGQYVRGDLSLATFPSIPAAQVNSDWNAVSGVAQILNQPAIPSVARNTSSLSLSLVGTGATGTQISSTKDSSVRLNVSTSTTSTIGGPSTSLVTLKKCATNNATEGSWTAVCILENDQTITLAIVLNSIQAMKGQLCADVPAGWYVKLVPSGTGTHTETSISGEQTIYG